MAMQYKPTKQKKEKPAKAPKAPKPEKLAKMGGAMKVKTSKPAKVSKQPKAPKPEKAMSFAPAFKGGKVENAQNLEKNGVLKKPVNLKIVIPIFVVLIVIAVLIFTVLIPTIKRNGEIIDRIMISKTPDKTIYLIGEEANYDGLRVSVVRNNGESFVVRANQCEINGFDSISEGYKVITVTYQGHIATFSIKVDEVPRPTPALSEITLETLPKTEYKVGEGLETDGGVILCHYVDGSVFRVSLVNSYVYGDIDFNTPGDYQLTVKYVEKGIVCKTTYTITVTE